MTQNGYEEFYRQAGVSEAGGHTKLGHVLLTVFIRRVSGRGCKP